MNIHRRNVIVGLLSALGTCPGMLRPAFATESESEATKFGLADHGTVVLRLVGDDSIALDIAQNIAAHYLTLEGARDVSVESAVGPRTVRVRGRLLSGETIAVLISTGTTQEGYKRFTAQESDIWLAGSSLTQREAPSENGGLIVTPLARYALVMVVHPDNPIRTLSYEELAGIYAGRITDWSALGGQAGPITVLASPVGAASRNNLEGLLFTARPNLPTLQVMETAEAMHDAVADNPAAIGYVPIRLVSDVAPLTLSVGGTVTSSHSAYGLRSGDYPLAKTAWLHQVDDARATASWDFLRVATSPRAEYMMGKLGYEPVKPRLLLPDHPPELPSRIDPSVSTTNLLRISTTIHFKPHTPEMTAVARGEIENLASYLRRLAVGPEHMLHLCYAEASGDAERDIAVSSQLGQAFLAELAALRVYHGAMVPLGSRRMLVPSFTPAAMSHNRRVETWIRT